MGTQNQITLAQLRAASLASLWLEPDLPSAFARMGFVQADPIRAPARAQDLILFQRVQNYRAGELERDYGNLGIEEDCFVNYGFVRRDLQALMHPRQFDFVLRIERDAPGLLEAVLKFVDKHGPTHPKTLQAHFGKQQVRNGWGGTSQASTRALEALHYQGRLRVSHRENGIKIFEVATHLKTRLNSKPNAKTMLEQAEGLLRLILEIYAPLPLPSLRSLINHCGYGAPQLVGHIRQALKTMSADGRLAHSKLDGCEFFWLPEHWVLDVPEGVRLLAPFDPVVWDRLRFEVLHGWAYRFEAYTPVAKRKLGYYALPMLWNEQLIGWANAKAAGNTLKVELGFVSKPKAKAFKQQLEAEISRMTAFLQLKDWVIR